MLIRAQMELLRSTATRIPDHARQKRPGYGCWGRRRVNRPKRRKAKTAALGAATDLGALLLLLRRVRWLQARRPSTSCYRGKNCHSEEPPRCACVIGPRRGAACAINQPPGSKCSQQPETFKRTRGEADIPLTRRYLLGAALIALALAAWGKMPHQLRNGMGARCLMVSM